MTGDVYLLIIKAHSKVEKSGRSVNRWKVERKTDYGVLEAKRDRREEWRSEREKRRMNTGTTIANSDKK